MQMHEHDSSDDPTVPFLRDDFNHPIPLLRRVFARVDAVGATHPGRVRKTNEDAYLIVDDRGLCAVADGLGGRPGGEIASAITLHHAAQFISEGVAPNATNVGEMLATAVRHSNDAVRGFASKDVRYKGMASTIVGLLFADRHVAIAHVGDSRAYRVRKGRITRLTIDHSMREQYLQVYKEKADPVIAARNAHLVTRAIGGQPRVEADVAVHPVELGDTFLLCSDGLWGLVSDEEMEFAFADGRTHEGVLAKLMATAYNRGGHDNITAVIARPRSVGWPRAKRGNCFPL